MVSGGVAAMEVVARDLKALEERAKTIPIVETILEVLPILAA